MFLKNTREILVKHYLNMSLKNDNLLSINIYNGISYEAEFDLDVKTAIEVAVGDINVAKEIIKKYYQDESLKEDDFLYKKLNHFFRDYQAQISLFNKDIQIFDSVIEYSDYVATNSDRASFIELRDSIAEKSELKKSFNKRLFDCEISTICDDDIVSKFSDGLNDNGSEINSSSQGYKF